MIRTGLVIALSLAAGVAAARPAMTGEPATMRAAPSSHARIVQHIPANAQIDIEGCRDRWCAASWRNLDGYVRVEAIGASAGGPVVTAPPPPYGYYGGPVVVGPVFGFGYYHRRYWW
jgi:uncharacterized protein YraI